MARRTTGLRHRMLCAAVLTLAACSLAAHAVEIKLSCTGVGQEAAFCKDAAQAWASKTGNTVQIVTPPNDASQRLGLYQQLLAAGSDKIDVLQLDVIWSGLFARHLVDLAPYAGGAQKQYLAGFIANNTVDGHLVAMPWFANAGLLFYRKDLLQKYQLALPTTWDALAAAARKVQDGERAAGHKSMWGYVFQGRAYEGLTCNALEWVASYGGGAIVEPDGKVSVANPAAAQALDTAAGWVGTIAPTAVLNYAEEESRGVFQAGNAVFMRNWPYAWALAQAKDSVVRDKVGVAVLPQGSGPAARHAATLGGESLAVSRYSRHPAQAADLVLYLTGAQVQKERALRGSFNPTIVALYQDAEILRANPFMGELADTFTHAIARPTTATGAHYNQVSNQFWNAAHDVLEHKSKAQPALARLDKVLQRLSRGGKWK